MTEEDLINLIMEVLEDPPINHCADEGAHCIFCYAPKEWYKNTIEHASDCWLIRAEQAVKEYDENDEPYI